MEIVETAVRRWIRVAFAASGATRSRVYDEVCYTIPSDACLFSSFFIPLLVSCTLPQPPVAFVL